MDGISQEHTESFESIYNRFYLPVYKFFAKRLSDLAVCEDLTSDVFYVCFKNYDKYDPSRASAATWIYTIANNKLKNYYRDKKDHRYIHNENTYFNLPDDSDMESAMESAIFIAQMKMHLMNALDSVSEREKSTINLRYFSEKSSEEIAVEIGTTAGNVRVILNRAIKKLTKYFEEQGIRWDF